MNVIHVTGRPAPQLVKISKVGAGYVYRKGSDYRCSECIHFIADKERCMLLGKSDVVTGELYCIEWAEGKRPSTDDEDWDDEPQGCYTPAEVGLGGEKNGTLCRRCTHFDPTGYCEIVDEKSPGDTPGKIVAGACCNNQEPREEKG